MGFFKKNKDKEINISFEANSNYNNDYEVNNTYNQNNNVNNNDDFSCEDFVNKKFNYKKALKKEKNESYSEELEEQMNLKLQKKQKIKTIIYLILSIYLVILFIGFLITPFYEKGDFKKGEVVSVTTLEERESYNKLKTHYVEISKLLQETEELNKLFKQSKKEDYFDLSSKYNAILPKIDKHIPKAKALKIDNKYTLLQKQSIDCYNSLAIYLQKISNALMNNNQATFNEAVSWNNKSFEDYAKFKKNMYQLSEKVKIPEKESFWNLIQ